MPEAAPNAGEEEAPAAAPTRRMRPRPNRLLMNPSWARTPTPPAPESTEAPPGSAGGSRSTGGGACREPSQGLFRTLRRTLFRRRSVGSSSASAVEEDDESGKALRFGRRRRFEDEAAKAPVRHVTPIPHGFVPVSLEERSPKPALGLDRGRNSRRERCGRRPASIQRAVDEAFLEKQSFGGAASSNAAAAGQAAEAAGRATAELLVDPPVDP